MHLQNEIRQERNLFKNIFKFFLKDSIFSFFLKYEKDSHTDALFV